MAYTLNKAASLVDFLRAIWEVDKFLIQRVAPEEYGNEGISDKHVISVHIWLSRPIGRVDRLKSDTVWIRIPLEPQVFI